MFERTGQLKSESNARILLKNEPTRFDRQDRTARTGPIVQNATLVLKELRIAIQQCFNPLHQSASDALPFGGSPQQKLCDAHCRQPVGC